MKTACVVIGANYGDEGKGQCTHNICLDLNSGSDTLVVRYNGGAQAGHTVYTENHRHVFQHIGSGTFTGAHTWLSDEFISNPLIFRTEFETLKKIGVTPCVAVSPKSRVTTPYDMLVNILRESQRGSAKHGSCGCGINETIQRNKRISLTVNDLKPLVDDYQQYREFMQTLLHDALDQSTDILGYHAPEFERDILDPFYEDMCFFVENTTVIDWLILDSYTNVVFESAQGLLLDEKYGVAPHLTPSSVGLETPVMYMNKALVSDDIDVSDINCQVYYLSRAYMTRHGAGELAYEVDKSYLGVNNPNETNVYNDNQGQFRYGLLDVNTLADRCTVDFLNNTNERVKQPGLNIWFNIVTTCFNQLPTVFPVIIDQKELKVCVETLQHFISSRAPTRKDHLC